MRRIFMRKALVQISVDTNTGRVTYWHRESNDRVIFNNGEEVMYFHSFCQEGEEGCSYPTAIMERMDGQLITAPVSSVKFIN